MRIAYLIAGTFNTGGMERVLCNKVNWLVARGYDITVITTDQQERKPFFEFSNNAKFFDLGINYFENINLGFIKKTISFLQKTYLHRKRLTALLKSECFDVVVSMYGNETEFLPLIKDGSAKLFEIHFSRYFRSESEKATDRGILYKMVAAYRMRQELKAIDKYDRFVVLTQQDKQQWLESGVKCQIDVISNFANKNGGCVSDTESHKQVLAVGRLDVIKGFDMLIKAWELVSRRHSDWHLKIYGNGAIYDKLQLQISQSALEHSISIIAPTSDIVSVYNKSDIYVLSSRCEGLPMVMLEAMACGVPCVSFACKCGPRDVIDDGVDGFLVEQNNIEQMAEKICTLIENEELRRQMGVRAVEKVTQKFSQEVVMQQWIKLFKILLNR